MTTLFLCLCLLIAAVQFSTVDSALPCNSPLRKYLPAKFTHCASCSYGQWSPWTRFYPLQEITSQTCASGKARRYERSRTAVPGSTCTSDTETQDKYECVPTLRQKAELIIRALRLGADADRGVSTAQPSQPVTGRPTRPRPTSRVTTPSFRVTRPPPTSFRGTPPTANPRTPYQICSDGTTILATQTCPPSPFTSVSTTQPRIFTTFRPVPPTQPRIFTTSRPVPTARIFTTFRIAPTIRPRTTPTRPRTTPTQPRTTPTRLTFNPDDSGPPSPYRRKRQTSINYCPTASQQANNRICPNMCPRGKRSLEEEEEVRFNRSSEQQILNAATPVELFNMDKSVNAIHERRHRQTCPSTIRYVLFIVDTSGSIGATTFNKVRDLLANISEKLCDHLRVAMMTYSHDINLEFCFKCHTDRHGIFNAIKRVQYRGGFTHTTDATKCACQKLLTPECGLPRGSLTPNIDVVYLTDGYHNGPCRSNLNYELDCLHTRTNINTYAIAIGNAARASVQALEDPRSPADTQIFDVDDFVTLEELFQSILLLLKENGTDGKPVFSCFSHDGPCGGR